MNYVIFLVAGQERGGKFGGQIFRWFVQELHNHKEVFSAPSKRFIGM